jgi:hypothetical protein
MPHRALEMTIESALTGGQFGRRLGWHWMNIS